MSIKRTQTLGFKLSIIILVFLLLVLSSCGILTYLNQMSSYRKQCEENLRDVGEYLEKLIEADGEDFVRYQSYFLEHYTEVDIPVDAHDYVPFLRAYERLFHQTYPGMSLGYDIQFDELSDEVKRAYLSYCQVYWLQTFDEAKEYFGLAWAYYILPDSRTESDIYIIDGTRPSRAEHIALMDEHPVYAKFDHPQGEEAQYLYLGDQVSNSKDKYAVKWAAWETGKKQPGFQMWDNEFGKTYACYTPVVIDGQLMGLIGTEIEIERVNTAILNNTLQQFFVIGLILVAGILIMMAIINRHYISKITDLESKVRDYSQTKDASVSEEIRKGIRGNDEVSSLSEGVAQMIDEIREYISSLVTIHQELDSANINASRMSELALKDGLTGIWNTTAYTQETDELGERLAQGNVQFAVAVIDLNNLKTINDVYGHDKGNVAIIKLSRIVCDTFQHSMVFRVGGDEFVALLVDEDYADRVALVRQAQDALDQLKQDETLPPWEKNSAAIGLATYDPNKDTSVQDVTRRADARMYEQKKRMKAAPQDGEA